MSKMNKEDRQRIIDNTKHLKVLVEFDKLLPKLRESEIFPEDMLLDVELCGSTNGERMEKLLKYLPKRGPKAFNKFMGCLNSSGFRDAVNLLSKDDEWDGRMIQSAVYYDNNFSMTDIYQMKSKPRGLALILSFIDFNGLLDYRSGGEIDVDVLTSLFTELGFVVEVKHNLTSEEATETITTFKDDYRHKSADASIICILSHGTKEGFYCSNHNIIQTDWLLNQFNNVNCTNLHFKPKLFFLQYCRGDEIDYAIEPDGDWHTDSVGLASVTEEKRVYNLPTLATWTDMKICFSTSVDKLSYRSKINGTFFVRVLADVFRRRAHDTHLSDMMIEVTNRMLSVEFQGCKQSTEVKDRGWRKKLYFNPGL